MDPRQWWRTFVRQAEQWLERFRLRLAGVEALPQRLVLGAVTGLLAGGVIVAFRLFIEALQDPILPGGGEDYESLTPLIRFLLPLLGALLLGVLLQYIRRGPAAFGMLHVMERLAYYQGRMPFSNALHQFFTASLSIASGHSVGREGPSVHLGAASGSLLGQGLRLPHNSIRTLVACGVAAAIGASFNTPLAGVIFSMEVVLMEYTIAGFAPVILSAVTATALMQIFYGASPAFAVPPVALDSIRELPIVMAMGIAIGGLAAVFIQLLAFFSSVMQARPLWQRNVVGGAITGLCALPVPAVMGIGYDTVTTALTGDLGLSIMVAIVAFKIIATTACLGLGLPGGLIGPTLVIGACAGGTFGLLATVTMPGEVSSPAFYATVGMGAMMGATLQAPLAALVAMLELTANPDIILPGMLAVITSGFAASEIFRQRSVFVTLLRAQGLDYRNEPIAQSLRRVGVASVMSRDIVTSSRTVTTQQAQKLIADNPKWLVVGEPDAPQFLLPGADLARYLEEETPDADDSIDLLSIPALRQDLAPISLRANLQEALDQLSETAADTLYVTQTTAPGTSRIYGVLTRQDIEASYHYHPAPINQVKDKETPWRG